ncbi:MULTISPECIES: prolipoprotein diacylglyceryl transferase family protein [Streptococcus]|uniref:prolipoprotein diacylglyceryl transferase family protein n=1 Tax=Streptococcus TaxID=1301 RepID=UPI001604AC76|nr:prolipoprotein diacylglyceryl transferase family protein [Streptococcus iniae]
MGLTFMGTISRVALSFGPFTVNWYGIIIAAAILIAVLLQSFNTEYKSPILIL